MGIYWNSLGNQFVWDDRELIIQNPYIKKIHYIDDVFSPTYWLNHHPGSKGQYRPLRAFTFMLNYTISGLNPWGYHLVNTLFHLSVCLSLFFLGLTIYHKRWIAFLLSAFFAVHPVATEAVTWTKNRSEVMATLFGILAVLLLHLSLKEKKDQGESLHYGFLTLSLFSCLLSLLSKESGVVFPTVCLWFLICFHHHIARGARIFIASFYLTLLTAYFSFLFFVLKNPTLTGEIPSFHWETLKQAMFTILYYLKMLLVPLPLTADIGMTLPGIIDNSYVIGFSVLLLIGAAAFIWDLNRSRTLAFSLGWLTLALLPISNILPITGRPIAEERAYPLLVGFSLVIGSLLAMKASGVIGTRTIRSLGVCGLVILIPFYAFKVIQRNPVWYNGVSLWEAHVETTPLNPRVRSNLGTAYLREKRLDEAIREYKKAVDLAPFFVINYNNLGTILAKTGQDRAAEHLFKVALKISPEYTPAICNLANLYARWGDFELAIEYFEKGMSISPQEPVFQNNLGNVYLNKGDIPQARSLFESAVQHDPDMATARKNLGTVLAIEGQYSEAAEQFLRYVELEPGESEGFLYLGTIFLILREKQKSMKYFEKFYALEKQSPHERPADSARRSSEMPYEIGEKAKSAFQLKLAQTSLEKEGKLSPFLTEIVPQRIGIKVSHERLLPILRHSKECAATVEMLTEYFGWGENSEDRRMSKAFCYNKMEQFHLESLQYRALLKSEPGHPEAKFKLAMTLERMGQIQEAISIYESISPLYEKMALVKFNLARLQFAEGLREEALSLFQEAVQIDPLIHQAWSHLAYLYFEQKDYGNAAASLANATRLQPDDQDLRQFYVLNLWLSGKLTEARAILVAPMARQSDNSFQTFWIWAIDRKLGYLDPDLHLRTAFQDPEDQTWEGMLAAFLLGKVDRDQLLKSTIQNESKLCEAAYYIGLEALFAGKREVAFHWFTRASSLPVPDVAEYHLALQEIDELRTEN